MRVWLLVALVLVPTCASAQVSTAHWAGNAEVVFYLDFEDGPYAWKAAGNPYQIGSQFEIGADGKGGQGWRNTSKMGYIGFDGKSNVPVECGTVSMRVKSGAIDIFTDGQKHCFASLPRTCEGMFGDRERWGSEGLALSLRKTERNTVDLIVHVGGDSWMRGSEPVTAISVDASALSPTDWHHLMFSWDFATRKLWLAIDGEAQSAPIPEVIEQPHEYLAAVFGNTQDYLAANQEPLDGMMDEIAILNVAHPRAVEVMSTENAYEGQRPQDPTWRAEATLFPDDESLARCERVARQHLKMLVETQRYGSWCLGIKWPSRLQFTAKYRLPEPRNAIWLSKDSHTAFAAMLLLWAYEALGDEQYLDAARNTAEMYLTTQDPEEGYWVHGYYYENGQYVPASTVALIQDHVQTGPLLLLCYMHKVTGEEGYLEAAKKSAEFLVKIQNPNGSWSHHYEPAEGVAKTSSGVVGGGEVNDYGTSAPVSNLFQMYRLTGEEKYREAALRGADWLVQAFIDNDKVAGWAGQYDDKNRPSPARHHEPAAVTQYAPRWAANGLFAAYRETLDDKYLEPLRKVLAWFDANKLEGGWWWDYDIETGRPIRMWRRQMYFMDDPEQVKAYCEATGGSAPTPGDSVKVDQLRNEVRRIQEQPEGRIYPQPSQEDLAKHVEATAPNYVRAYLQSTSQPLNERAGLYTWETQAGQSTNLVRHQVVRFCDLLMRARAARGDIPADNPVFRRNEAFVGWHKIMPEVADE